ncbi:MAG: hypothetical protein OEZ55_08935 [Nitrospinota bacterium]|nr:hypothetical protein [Nitrospinota bacterium]
MRLVTKPGCHSGSKALYFTLTIGTNIFMFEFSYTSTVEDLLDADKALRAELHFRASYRWFAAFLGFFFLVAGILASALEGVSVQFLIWILIGTTITFYFIVAPHLARKRIRANNMQYQDVFVVFGNNGIRLDVLGIGAFERNWEELVYYVDTPVGVILIFDDGIVNSLPNRVFADSYERKTFIDYLESHKRRMEEEES